MSYHHEDEAIDPIIFAATVGLGNIINKLISSNFMGMVSSVSVIFDTGANYSCYSVSKCTETCEVLLDYPKIGGDDVGS